MNPKRYGLIFSSFCLFCCMADGADLRQDFAEPPLKYATRPLWFWNNTAVTEEGIVEQMQAARDKCGYGGFGILPFGKGFKPAYLTEDYFKAYGVALKKAKELGMTMCIYDEYGYPSGSAGALHGDGVPRFAKKHPNHTIKRLDKHEEDVTGPCAWSKELPTGRVMSIVGMETAGKTRVDLTGMIKDGQVAWRVPKGTWKIMIFVCVEDGDPNVDYMDPEAVAHFVEMTHQQYYNRFKEYFGNTIDGTFHDEPTMYRAKGRIWTGGFNKKFKARHGFDPAPYYPALWYDIGPETQAARNYLFGFRTELYATGFPRVIQEWSARHGIAATGHQDQEEVVNPVSVAGDLMKCFKHQDIPGVDKIGGRAAERFYKVISSAAYNWDKALVMSETYGAMGDISWETIYHVAMEQYSKGVNQLIPHAVWYDDKTVGGYKPELSWRNSKYASGLLQYNKYMSRLNLMLQNHGRHVADVAVLYPIATLQAGHYLDGKLGHYRGGVAIPEADYVDIGEMLATQLGCDYTFIHPEVLDDKCTIEGDTLRLNNPVNHESYKVMIIPGHKTINWSNLKKVKAFYDNGGKVIATGTLAQKSAEFGHDGDVVKTIEALFPRAKKAASESGKVTASSSWPGHDPELVTDGSEKTRWNAKDGTSGHQWLEIDLGEKTNFNRVEIIEVFNRVTSYSIQYLEGGKWVDCASGTTLGHKVHAFDQVASSKVRLYIHAVQSDSASIAEFTVASDDGSLSLRTEPPACSRNKQGGMAVFLKRPTAKALRGALDGMQKVYDVEFEEGKELRYIHKIKDGRHIYFLANLRKTPIRTWVTLRGTLQAELWNPHTGDISRPEYVHEKMGASGVTKVKLELMPTKSIFVIAQARDAEPKEPKKESEDNYAPTLKNGQVVEAPTDVSVTDLRCEYLTNPLGIDVQHPRFSWKLVDSNKTRGQKQTAYRIVVTGGSSADRSTHTELWDSGTVVTPASVNNVYAGVALTSGQNCYWKVRVWDKDGHATGWSSKARFSMGLLETSDWEGDWIGYKEADNIKHIWYRKTLSLESVPSLAFVHLGSIGYHELYVNGQKAGTRVLSPGVTNLNKRALYVTYDITDKLKNGNNVIAVWTGPGWARNTGSYGKTVWEQKSLFTCQVSMSNGMTVHSDASWTCKISSSENLGMWRGGGQGEYGGESIDARRHIADWNMPSFDDADWANASVYPLSRILSASMIEPDRKVETLTPVEIVHENGLYRVDMGRNFTGWLEVNLRNGNAGDTVKFMTANQPGKVVEFKQESHYIHDATGSGTFSHRFNYMAGRWITIEGLSYKPKAEDIKCYIVTNDRKRTGSFECSKELFNRIYETDLRTYIANTVNGVVMDCPHRERYGYGEIAFACSWGCGLPNYDSAAFYTKSIRDWFDVQREDGFVNTIAPQIYKGAGGTLWSSAPVTLSWEFHKAYGDMRHLENAYGPMKKWLDFLNKSVSDDGILTAYDQQSRFLGDWATPHGSEYGGTPAAQLFNNCVYAYNLDVFVKVAGILGKRGDAARYSARLAELRKNVHGHFFNEEAKTYIDGRQLSMVFPLYTGVTPAGERKAVFAKFVDDITNKKPYLDTGSPGLPILLKYIIEDAERADLLYHCLTRLEQPGYGFFLSSGETTWPEYWQIVGHDSRIHTCYTSIAGYFTKGIGGIRPDPSCYGMKKFIIKPNMVGDVTYANTTSGSYYGSMVCNWSRSGNAGEYHIEIPPNTMARVYIPAENVNDVLEGGRPVAKAQGVTYLDNDGIYAVFLVDSGVYRFSSSSVPSAK